MEKNGILKQRKELKKRSHKIVKSHFVFLFFLTLIMLLFGTENRLSLSGWSRQNPDASSETEQMGDTPEAAEGSSVLDNGFALTAQNVIRNIMSGKLFKGQEEAEKLEQQIKEEGDISEALGRTNGVLAQVVNAVSAGKPAALLGSALYSIFHSQAGVAVVFVIASLLWQVLIYIFLKNVYSGIYRRIFLEARIYENVPFSDVLHFAAVRRWGRASWTLFVKDFYQLLWSLTIVGGLIKMYSYAAVPYIVAENPGVRAREAITLSRKMMNGHKMEMFKYDLTMIGWHLLSLVTFGISDLIYGVSYRTACRTEFYVKVREEAIRNKTEGWELLNDQYLFEKADRILLYETYFDVVDEITLIQENKIELKGVKKFVSDWFGIWLGTLEEKKRYDSQEGRKFSIAHYRMCMAGTAYPNWLNPLWRKKEISKQSQFSFLRNYSIWTLFLLFIGLSFIGWTWEVTVHYVQTGAFANRGTLFGPWLPIYGSGGVIVLLLCSRFRKNPVAEFFIAIVLCGILEYTSGWYLETKYHQRWWSYDGYFLNLHGRICAEGLLVFGVGCCLIVYMIAPLFDFVLSRLKKAILISICVVLAVLYGIDLGYSSQHPNMAEGAIEADTKETEAKETEDDAGTAAEKASDDAGAAAEKVSDDAGAAVEKSSDDVGTTAEKSSNEAGTASEKASDDAGAATEKASDETGTAAEKASDNTGSATEKASDEAGTASEEPSSDEKTDIEEEQKPAA